MHGFSGFSGGVCLWDLNVRASRLAQIRAYRIGGYQHMKELSELSDEHGLYALDGDRCTTVRGVGLKVLLSVAEGFYCRGLGSRAQGSGLRATDACIASHVAAAQLHPMVFAKPVMGFLKIRARQVLPSLI